MADSRLGLETAIVSPSFDDGLRRLSFNFGLFAGGSWSVFELGLVVLVDGTSVDAALLLDPAMPA